MELLQTLPCQNTSGAKLLLLLVIKHSVRNLKNDGIVKKQGICLQWSKIMLVLIWADLY